MSKNFIIVSTLDWNSNWQIPHEIVKTLIEQNNNVLYVENTGLRSVMFSDFKRISLRLKNFFNSESGFKRESSNLTIFSPPLIPFPYNNFSLKLNKLYYIESIRKWINTNNFNETILISFLPSPINVELIRSLKFDKVIYYCVDNLSSGFGDSKKIKKFENYFLKESDINFFTSSKLLKKNYIKQKSLLLPAGVNLKNFTKTKKLRKKAKIIIGYIGAISTVFDQDLVIKIANKINKSEIHLVGPILCNIDKLKKFKNIKYFGQVKHNLLQNYMINFDVGIIPYIKNNFTKSVYPCKLNEYLALGIPVVSTDINELKNIENKKIFSLSTNSEDFIMKINNEIKNDDQNKIKLRKKYAQDNSWHNRFIEFNNAISNIENKKISPENWVDLYFQQLQRFRRKIYKSTISILILYLVIFNSSLFWHIGNYLRYYEEPVKSDVLVVFSGDGEVSYQNDSYKDRALDAVQFYKSGLTKNIYLSTGRQQTISDTILIKSFLIYNGIEEKDIIIQEKFPSSTAQNIDHIYQILSQKKIKDILFLTSPFHSRRSMLIWKKYNINVTPIKSTRDDYIDRKYFLKLGDLKIIIYEYLSIIYNYLKGNIN